MPRFSSLLPPCIFAGLSLACSSDPIDSVPAGTTGGVEAVDGTGGTVGSGGSDGSGGTLSSGGLDSGTGGSSSATGGSASGGGTVAEPRGPSAGCSKAVNEPAQEYVKHEMTVQVDAEFYPDAENPDRTDYRSREYHTRLPHNYDPNKAYPVYIWGHGCGVTAGNPEGIPVQGIEEAQNESIGVFMIQKEGCFQAGKNGTENSPDIPYFGQMLDEIEDQYCVDRGNVFVGGKSSSAWMAATASCAFGDRLRAIAMIAGGQQPDLPSCKGTTAAIFWVGETDPENPIVAPDDVAWSGSSAVRDRLLASSGCSQASSAWDARWPECQIYDGCEANPIVWCAHGGGHDLDPDIMRDGFWEFFRDLPAEE